MNRRQNSSTQVVLPGVRDQVAQLYALKDPDVNVVLFKLEEVQTDLALAAPEFKLVAQAREALVKELVKELWVANFGGSK